MKFQHKILIQLCFFLIFTSTVQVFASGKLEEKYYFVLNGDFSEHHRQLEKHIFEYSRANDSKLVLFPLSDTTLDQKKYILKEGAEDKYPVLIFQNYEPELIEYLTQQYYKKGEFYSSGLMGSFLVLDASIPNTSLTLPWKSIVIDTNYMANEIFSQLSISESKSTDKSNTANSDNTSPTTTENKQIILVAVDTLTEKEMSLSKQLFISLQEYLKTNNIQTIQLQEISSLGNESDESKPLFKSESQSEYQIRTQLEKYLNSNKDIHNNIVALIVLNDIFAIELSKILTAHNISAQLIGFGASPEAQQAMENNQMSMTFQIDYNTYVQQIMDLASELIEAANTYTLTDDMIDDNSLYESFPSEITTFPVKAIKKQ